MEIKETKTWGSRIWEFIISGGGILGILKLFGAEITQGLAFAILGGGIVLITINHIISFFQKLDENIKYIKNKLNGEEDKDAKEEENRD